MTSRQRRLAIFGGLNIALVVLGWVVLISPQRSDAASATAKEQLVQTQLAALTSGNPKGPTKQPAIHTSDIYTLDTALPSQVDQPELLLELDQLATASSVKILSLAPQTPTAVTGYTIQPITLSLSGNYFQLTGFLRSLRLLVSEHQGHLIANGPLFAVTSVGLAPGQSAAKTGKSEVATVSMAAYYYGTVGGATPPATTTDTTTTSTTGG